MAYEDDALSLRARLMMDLARDRQENEQRGLALDAQEMAGNVTQQSAQADAMHQAELAATAQLAGVPMPGGGAMGAGQPMGGAAAPGMAQGILSALSGPSPVQMAGRINDAYAQPSLVDTIARAMGVMNGRKRRRRTRGTAVGSAQSGRFRGQGYNTASVGDLVTRFPGRKIRQPNVRGFGRIAE